MVESATTPGRITALGTEAIASLPLSGLDNARSFAMVSANSKARRALPCMGGDEDELWLLEEDIVVHESWWWCGPQNDVEEDMVVKLGPWCCRCCCLCCRCCCCLLHVVVHKICSTEKPIN